MDYSSGSMVSTPLEPHPIISRQQLLLKNGNIDWNGSLRNTWNEQAVKAFDEPLRSAFIEQYSEFDSTRGYPDASLHDWF
uniref:Uncharacterized protein n=1 Tax=Parascaris univalens TaxID=6257 RepID=A0A915CLK7_PARUN